MPANEIDESQAPMPQSELSPPSDEMREASTDDTWSPRTAFGAAWRGAAVLALAVTGVPVGAWFASKLVPYDDRLVSAAFPLVLAIGALVNVWLRARTVFLVVVALSGAFALLVGTYLIDEGYVSADSPYLTIQDNRATFGLSSLAVGAGVMFVTILWGTVSGYLHPRPKREPKDQP
ncbi:hypothetical protein FE633_33415 [Streptomyces montanus]|uniref:Uncharacterized protein n=1 Tax=Streptomyces montanus TaxID=2580423 RepID=A0A5R9FII0_9ACTN|nr:hypothetical protein [Streptomyces montanus]TLS41976.1 hypothetical protein FE633_33415 [Streptomyces montanus]